jgi:hypothetical protein
MLRAIEREFPYALFGDSEDDLGTLVCRTETDSRNIDLMRAFAAGFVAACKEEP